MREVYEYETITQAYEGLSQEEDEQELETLHIYVSREPRRAQWSKDRVVALVMGVLALALMIGLCCIPSGPTWEIQTRTIPAQIVTQFWRASASIMPTGKHTTPATPASGVLAVYNGSFLVQSLPADFLLTSSSGVEIETDQAVIIPPGNPPNYGISTVSAHAIQAGQAGNIPALAINQAYAPLYLKNLASFSGGQDATTTTYATSQDVATATARAREQVQAAQTIGLLARPCQEQTTRQALLILVTRSCAYAHYAVPRHVEILSVRVVGATVVLRVRVARKEMPSPYGKH